MKPCERTALLEVELLPLPPLLELVVRSLPPSRTRLDVSDEVTDEMLAELDVSDASDTPTSW